MRQAFIITYDISDPKRLRRVFRLLRGYGEHLQLSVFRCELTRREYLELRSQLGEIIHQDADQVLFVDTGPTEGRGADCVTALGRVYTQPERRAIVA